MISSAISKVASFKGFSLADTIASIEKNSVSAGVNGINQLRKSHNIDKQLLESASIVKHISAQIDVVIHSVGMIYALPYLLEQDEIIQGLSLGAGTAGSDFDLVTDKRIAEFKFIKWQGGSEAVRKKTLFQDYYKLVREETEKKKYIYLLNTEIPLKFLKGKSNILRLLSRNQSLRVDFQNRYKSRYDLVGDFFDAHKNVVQFVNLVDEIPDFSTLMASDLELFSD